MQRQALLDIYTIEREIGKLDGINVGLVGDLAYGRTVRSLAYLLAKYRDVKIYFVSPDVVQMKVISFRLLVTDAVMFCLIRRSRDIRQHILTALIISIDDSRVIWMLTWWLVFSFESQRSQIASENTFLALENSTQCDFLSLEYFLP